MSQKLYVGGIAFSTTSEGLRAHFGLQIEHHTDHARAVARDELVDGDLEMHFALALEQELVRLAACLEGE